MPSPCAICFDDLRLDGDEGLRLATLRCGHLFHRTCLAEALKRQQKCPTCRQPVKRGDGPILLYGTSSSVDLSQAAADGGGGGAEGPSTENDPKAQGLIRELKQRVCSLEAEARTSYAHMEQAISGLRQDKESAEAREREARQSTERHKAVQERLAKVNTDLQQQLRGTVRQLGRLQDEATSARAEADSTQSAHSRMADTYRESRFAKEAEYSKMVTQLQQKNEKMDSLERQLAAARNKAERSNAMAERARAAAANAAAAAVAAAKRPVSSSSPAASSGVPCRPVASRVMGLQPPAGASVSAGAAPELGSSRERPSVADTKAGQQAGQGVLLEAASSRVSMSFLSMTQLPATVPTSSYNHPKNTQSMFGSNAARAARASAKSLVAQTGSGGGGIGIGLKRWTGATATGSVVKTGYDGTGGQVRVLPVTGTLLTHRPTGAGSFRRPGGPLVGPDSLKRKRPAAELDHSVKQFTKFCD